MQEEVAQKVLNVDFVDRGTGHSRFELAFSRLGPVMVGRCLSTSAEIIRYNHHLKDCEDGFSLHIIGRGPVHLSHAGEEHTYDVGWGHFLHHMRPYRQLGPSGFNCTNVTVWPAALETLVAHPEDLAGYPVRPGPALGLLEGYIQSLTSLDEPTSPELARTAGSHLIDLVAAVLGPTADAREIIAGRGVRAARIRQIRAEITRRCSDPGFDLNRAARTLGLSRRHIQKLLEETDRTFTAYLAECRLERAFTMLNSRGCDHLSITDVAFAAGFGDVSHFNRLFRRRFGDTPSGVRGARMKE